MAISHVLAQVDGNEVRSSMSLVDFDGADANGIGSTMGLTVVTALNGVDVDASAALLYTSAAIQNNKEFMDAAVAILQAGLTGGTVYAVGNTFDKYVINIVGINEVANTVDISTPVMTVV